VGKRKNISLIKSIAFYIAGYGRVFRFSRLSCATRHENGKMSELQWHPSRYMYFISLRTTELYIVIEEIPDSLRIV